MSKTGHEVLNSIKGQILLHILVLVQVPPEKVSDTLLHDSLFHLWELLVVEVEVLDELLGDAEIFLLSKSFDELDLEVPIMVDKHFGSLKFVVRNKFHHDKGEVKVLLEFILNNHSSNVVESLGVMLFLGYLQQQIISNQILQ